MRCCSPVLMGWREVARTLLKLPICRGMLGGNGGRECSEGGQDRRRRQISSRGPLAEQWDVHLVLISQLGVTRIQRGRAWLGPTFGLNDEVHR